MTGVSGAASITGSPLSKWQLALAVGAPVALGLGYIYYKNANKPVSKPNRGKLKSNSKENGTSAADKQISIDVDCPPNTATNFEIESPLEKAQRFKNKGNDYFNTGRYDEAIVQYNNAIDTCPVENTDDLATFYQNRAAAYEQLKKYSGVKADCTKALELKPRYAKALLRRARALEHYNDLEAALEDVTAACFVGAFTNKTAVVMADRLLEQLGKKHAIQYSSHMKHIMPSKHFIKNYINSFHYDPVFTMLQNDDDDNSNISPSFAKILKCVKEQKYDDVIPLCTEEIDSSDPDTLPHKMQALLLRATFYLLQAQYDAAIEDFGTIINSDNVSKDIKVNALIKRGSLYMQVERPEISLSDFDLAVELNPDCSDIYSLKGQVNMRTDNIEEARENFKKAVELNPNFGVAYVQKCYTDYHYGMMKKDMGMVVDALNDFEKAFEKFPNCIDCYILFAQILSEKEEYYKADTYFATAMEIDPNDALIYVHRGWLQLKWKGDVNKGIEYINKAIQLDDKCEFGYEALATIEAQRGNLEEAIPLFNKALALCRTNTELIHMFSLIDVTKTQLALKEKGFETLLNIRTVS
ncbi:mitochondrial import receptor subunit TOM70 [Colletes gigas]|uniref:mitochondrial import receptor subunit TOM70 n=1 Tax=Colletes gigas TaxID=935657 RepID=UPI001C9A41BA|nr:mitochondrial import receptor subunit TOM70 [Colletes gigas]